MTRRILRVPRTILIMTRRILRVPRTILIMTIQAKVARLGAGAARLARIKAAPRVSRGRIRDTGRPDLDRHYVLINRCADFRCGFGYIVVGNNEGGRCRAWHHGRDHSRDNIGCRRHRFAAKRCGRSTNRGEGNCAHQHLDQKPRGQDSHKCAPV